MEEKKRFWQSKTKLGALLVGLGAILGTAGGWLSGSLEPMSAVQALIIEIGAVLGVCGIRDLPFVNKEK